ncbi:hypothetical protein HY492_03750, partial [Candidatus Woesearchaeota archaeon]|nr:hypothetical protein [Candidatus Woesearchaeota archaeon]
MLSREQQAQENEYAFPYHYLDLARKEIAILECFDAKYRWKRAIEFFQITPKIKLLDAGCG